ncbi:VanZ family protein [Arthrobacter citreus]|nr:VanZ family protein [Arthrobacter citreus]
MEFHMQKNSSINTVIKYWLPVILIAGIIFYSSATPYEKQDIRPEISHMTFLYDMMEHFDFVHFNYAGEEVSIKSLGVPGFTEFFIRKLSHFTIYLLLAFFTIRLSRLYFKRYYLVGILIAAIYSMGDEFHQSFTAGRTPLVQDVVIDCIGAMVGACLYYLINKRHNARVQKTIRV